MKIQTLQQKNGILLTVKQKVITYPIMKLNSLESSLRDYSDPYILVTGNINVTGGNNNTKVVFKNCAPFKKCRTEVNEIFVDDVQHINIAMPMYNLIEYSDNYSDTSGSLWQFKGDEIEGDDDLTVDAQHIPNNSSSFKYKSSFIMV